MLNSAVGAMLQPFEANLSLDSAVKVRDAYRVEIKKCEEQLKALMLLENSLTSYLDERIDLGVESLSLEKNV